VDDQEGQSLGATLDLDQVAATQEQGGSYSY